MSGEARPVLCSRCEAVCCRLPVLLLPGDEGVPPWLVASDRDGPDTMARGEDGWCAALDRRSMRCSIYAQRPQICRGFEMGGGDCRDERAAWSARYRDEDALAP